MYDVFVYTSAEACSTTEDGDEPLHCPTGYECHIINPGDPAAGIPNRGQCIKQRSNSGMKKQLCPDLREKACLCITLNPSFKQTWIRFNEVFKISTLFV